MLTDNDLLDFDHVRLHMDGDVTPRKLLTEHGEVYRAQLVAAHFLKSLADGLEASGPGFAPDGGFHRGQISAYRDAVAHLRQGDFLPGSDAYNREMGDHGDGRV